MQTLRLWSDVSYWTWDQRQNKGQRFWFIVPILTPVDREGQSTCLLIDANRDDFNFHKTMIPFRVTVFHRLRFFVRLHLSTLKLLLYPGVDVDVHMQNVRSNVKVLERQCLSVFLLHLTLLTLLIKPFSTKAYGRHASGDCSTSDFYLSHSLYDMHVLVPRMNLLF